MCTRRSLCRIFVRYERPGTFGPAFGPNTLKSVFGSTRPCWLTPRLNRCVRIWIDSGWLSAVATDFPNLISCPGREAVGVPATWGQFERLQYTKRLAEVLVKIGHGPVREISTVPIGHRELGAEMLPTAVSHLRALVDFLGGLKTRVGSGGGGFGTRARLSSGVFLGRDSPVRSSWGAPAIRRYLGVCHDTCHAAVVREPQDQAISAYQQSEIRIGKVQCSSVPVVDCRI